jgi:hypothetical protein
VVIGENNLVQKVKVGKNQQDDLGTITLNAGTTPNFTNRPSSPLRNF